MGVGNHVLPVSEIERFQAKWIPVRVKKTRQIKRLERVCDSIRSERALDLPETLPRAERQEKGEFKHDPEKHCRERQSISPSIAPKAVVPATPKSDVSDFGQI
jgi:hypothetical protein